MKQIVGIGMCLAGMLVALIVGFHGCGSSSDSGGGGTSTTTSHTVTIRGAGQ